MIQNVETSEGRQDLPSGQVTFLITDLEASSEAWEIQPAAARLALRYHDRVASGLCEQHGGVVINHTGDGIKAVFTSCYKALLAATEMQRRFQEERWDEVERMRVRIGLHSGISTPDGDDYYGGVINRAARVADIANGDQIAVTDTVVAAAGRSNQQGLRFVHQGHLQLKGCGREHIYLVEADQLISDDRPLRVRKALAGSGLPPEGQPLIGRQAEVEQVAEFLACRRLVSIVGLGGVGKTRLAISAARTRSETFADGVVYCPLAPISADGSDPRASALAALAEALGARRQPGQDLLSSIVSFVENRAVLIVLDNCEHVRSTVSALVECLLAVEGPTVLVTSRESLEVAGEQRVNLEPLQVDLHAVELLVERALERDSTFDWERHQETLRGIGRHLDGIPLALEIAAARLRVLSPEQLLRGLRSGLAVLGEEATSRNQSLTAALSWSFEQLTEQQQANFEALCVFAGGFTVEAAAAVLSIDDELALLDDLSQLVDLSLLKTQRAQGEMMFSMLETIRQFGLENLSQRSPELLDRHRDLHAAYYADLASHCGRNLMTAGEGEVWTRIDASSSNLRLGFDHLVRTGELDVASTLLVDLAWFSMFAMRMEVFTWARELLEMPALEESSELWAVRSAGQYLTGDAGCARSAERSLELDPEDPTGLANTTLASVALNNTFDADVARTSTGALFGQPSARYREKEIVGLGLHCFALCLRAPNDDAVKMAQRLVREAHITGSATALTIAYWAQAVANLIIDWPTSDEAIRRGRAMADSLSKDHLISHLINGLVVHFSALTGPVEEAAATTAAEIRATMERHYLVGASHLLGAASVVLCRSGRGQDGAALLGAMMAHGHRPRREVREVVEASLNGNTDAFNLGTDWSINQAGEQATVWLGELSGSSMVETAE